MNRGYNAQRSECAGIDVADRGASLVLDVAMHDAILAQCEMIVYTYSGAGVIREPGGIGTPVLCPFDARSAG